MDVGVRIEPRYYLLVSFVFLHFFFFLHYYLASLISEFIV